MHNLVSTSEAHSTAPWKDKTLKLCLVARWKQRPSLVKLSKILSDSILPLREFAAAWDEHILPDRHHVPRKMQSTQDTWFVGLFLMENCGLRIL